MSARMISVIDDDESMLIALAGLLRSFGFDVKTYHSAEDFIRSDHERSSDCVITDIQMPGLSGIELKHWLDARSSAIPVIMITARSETHLHAKAFASGAVCLLKKPFDADTLMACLKRAKVG